MTTPLFGEERIILQDVAVFQVQNRAYLLSDLKPVMSDLETFREANPKSFLLKTLKLGKVTRPTFPHLTYDNWSENGLFLEQILLLVKFYQHIENQRNYIETDDESTFESSGGSALPPTGAIISLAQQGENFLVSRFSESSIPFTEKDLGEMKKKYPEKSQSELKMIFKDSKRENLMLNFFQSLGKQIEHHLFWN